MANLNDTNIPEPVNGTFHGIHQLSASGDAADEQEDKRLLKIMNNMWSQENCHPQSIASYFIDLKLCNNMSVVPYFPEVVQMSSNITSTNASATFAFDLSAGSQHIPAHFYATLTSDHIPESPAPTKWVNWNVTEAGSERSSQQSELVQQPTSPTADTGTYSCTYQGCVQHFETPQILEEHQQKCRQERYLQTGTHICKAMILKPCNIKFERSYDLARHDQTAHNVHMQRIGCESCSSTFSRNDALLRHTVRIQDQFYTSAALLTGDSAFPPLTTVHYHAYRRAYWLPNEYKEQKRLNVEVVRQLERVSGPRQGFKALRSQ